VSACVWIICGWASLVICELHYAILHPLMELVLVDFAILLITVCVNSITGW